VGDLSTPLEKAQVKIGNLQFFSSPPKPESNCCAEQNCKNGRFLGEIGKNLDFLKLTFC